MDEMNDDCDCEDGWAQRDAKVPTPPRWVELPPVHEALGGSISRVLLPALNAGQAPWASLAMLVPRLVPMQSADLTFLTAGDLPVVKVIIHGEDFRV